MCDLSCSNTVNSIGLVLDIIGALLIWKFGLPESINRDGTVGLAAGVDEEQIEKAKMYDSMATVGVTLLVAGFCVQLLSNFV